jgi:spore coat protein CotF
MKGTYLTPEMANILKDALISAGKSEKDLNKMAVKLGYEIPSNELLEKMGYVKQ